MKSVGEVMSVGRSFEEALQKALRMTGTGVPGLCAEPASGRGTAASRTASLDELLSRPTDKRIFAVYRALAEGRSVDEVHALTKIDRWFLGKIASVAECEGRLAKGAAGLERELLARAKRLGFSDLRIGELAGMKEREVRMRREKLGIRPVVKKIDTLAAEFPAVSNYLYMTYLGEVDDAAPSNKGVMVLGSGAYRIGSSVEFDWCCVNAVDTARKLGKHTIMVNCNPETVSTDYDVCDRLYFEELSLERVLDIYEFERPEGLILSMGGQIPNNLAMELFDAGAVILGTDPRDIDRAENRHKFSALLEELGVEQPAWKELTDLASAEAFAEEVGYPVLVRPSYVLSGAAMSVAWDAVSLERSLTAAAELNLDHPVVMSKFIEDAKEVEIDAVARRGEILYHAVMEHIENAGVHSGDATIVLPPQRLYIETVRKARRVAAQVAAALRITGPFNIQFLAQGNRIRVIECNLRASRSFPFCSKVTRVNMIDLATRAMLDASVERRPYRPSTSNGWESRRRSSAFRGCAGPIPCWAWRWPRPEKSVASAAISTTPCSRPCSRWASAFPRSASFFPRAPWATRWSFSTGLGGWPQWAMNSARRRAAPGFSATTASTRWVCTGLSKRRSPTSKPCSSRAPSIWSSTSRKTTESWSCATIT